ncbi:MAG TPA: anti-sigma F factor [Syntrophomonadaceae bacterium]|nr:anti-sigma F factor [Syntrophomonadaceae bacterium]HNX29178.1 anti-sigma F factor [Syntrophomonadaceae bacterium]HPR92546.1 anti-sigma F factor [Syntrophomonadaceae bacterium]
MEIKNYVHFEFQSLPENVSFARACVGAFASQLDCTLDDIEEIKLVVSEAVSNSIIHGYENRKNEKVEITVKIYEDHALEMIIKDYGIGIEDIDKAMQANYSSDDSRMGLGFTFMQSFTDEMEVLSKPGEGTSVRLKRSFLKEPEAMV